MFTSNLLDASVVHMTRGLRVVQVLIPEMSALHDDHRVAEDLLHTINSKSVPRKNTPTEFKRVSIQKKMNLSFLTLFLFFHIFLQYSHSLFCIPTHSISSISFVDGVGKSTGLAVKTLSVVSPRNTNLGTSTSSVTCTPCFRNSPTFFPEKRIAEDEIR